VLVDDQWRGKLADFNLSTILNQQTSSTPLATNPTWLVRSCHLYLPGTACRWPLCLLGGRHMHNSGQPHSNTTVQR